MGNLPNGTLWKASIDNVLLLKPPHVSSLDTLENCCGRTIIYAHTPLCSVISGCRILKGNKHATYWSNGFNIFLKTELMAEIIFQESS